MLNIFPNDILIIIFSFCGINNRKNLLLVSKKFNKCCDFNNLFYSLFEEDKSYLLLKINRCTNQKLLTINLSFLVEPRYINTNTCYVLIHMCKIGNLDIAKKICLYHWKNKIVPKYINYMKGLNYFLEICMRYNQLKIFEYLLNNNYYHDIQKIFPLSFTSTNSKFLEIIYNKGKDDITFFHQICIYRSTYPLDKVYGSLSNNDEIIFNNMKKYDKLHHELVNKIYNK